eukprot:CAMPEP_0195086646 /NCGR_PEP_ID=MMETSP0448-20130528/26720_1 /TAXON_ID=66468 /ORGANISM="Heterocapsa triquestra, Strain CCMP 448" /LENGTH=1227 /DNA_ID=CAMNT_0040120147 /DNA_START=81 /DNA_END=3764 /DNA_ORIENTATION=-
MSAEFGFDGLSEAKCIVNVSKPGGQNTEVKISLRSIRRSMHLGNEVGCELHWAALDDNGAWIAPPAQPQGSRSVDPIASRIECKFDCSMNFPPDLAPKRMVFVVLVHAGGEHWLKAPNGQDFVVEVEELASKAAPVFTAVAPGSGAPGNARVAARPDAWPELEVAKAAIVPAADGDKKKGKKTKAAKATVESGALEVEGGLGKLLFHTVKGGDFVTVFVEAQLLLTEEANAFLHFGCQAEAGSEWECPEEPIPGTVAFGDGKATRAQFAGQVRTTLQFKSKMCPGAIAFVLYVQGAGWEQWLKGSNGADFGIGLKAGGGATKSSEPGAEVAKNFVDAETKYSHWSQFQRLNMVKDVLGRATPLLEIEAAWLATDLRLAQQKALEWYRNRGYQPKDMAHTQEALGGIMATAVESATNPTIRALLRLCVAACPRGSSSGGDAIRHGILNIMRNHGIKEGHRPGIECKFIEQWHQKLHTNSAPDDIAICEGYLAFLGSGNPDDLFRVVWENAQLTREDLEKMATCGFQDHTKSGARGLNVNPKHLPQLYNDMQGYLGLLKQVHGGTDLFSLCEACKGQYPDHGSECAAFEIFHGRDNPMTMGRIVDLRRSLGAALWKRDILMLDVAMESQLRMLAERQKFGEMGRDDLCGVLGVLLRDLTLSRRDPSLQQGMDYYFRMTEGDCGGHQRWSTEWCKHMLAACDRLSIVCAGVADVVSELLQQCADKLKVGGERQGAVFTPSPKMLATFGEETARSLSERLVAQCLKALQPQLRRGAGMGPWELVSAGGALVAGTIDVMKALPGELAPGKAPCIAVTETLTGWEDIPAGIVAVLLPAAHAVDVLSHVAIRARNQQVLLASCDDDALLAQLHGLAGQRMKLTVGPSGDVTWSKAAAGEGVSDAAAAQAPKQLKVVPPPAPPALILPMSNFAANRKSLGGKSFHLSELNPKAGDYKVPVSCTVPFGMFDKVLADPINEDFRERLEELIEEADWAAVRRAVVDELIIPDDLEDAITTSLTVAGTPLDEEKEWQRALKGVWASKWTDRAVSSRRQMGVPDSALSLAVLVQPLAFARYAFVIHTRSPLANAKKEDALVEVVVGLGESLVSNSPGRALSASVSPSGMEVHTLPSKPEGVFAPEAGTHIFRSDSNGEDLEGFAGAGLYDSITVVECPKRAVNYADEPLLFDAAFREKLVKGLFELGRLVEANFKGQPQDIEGAVLADGSLIVLQSRPQV